MDNAEQKLLQKVKKEELKQVTIKAFREAQEDDKRNYSLCNEAHKHVFDDKIWERKVENFCAYVNGVHPVGVLTLDKGEYCLEISKNSDAYAQVVRS